MTNPTVPVVRSRRADISATVTVVAGAALLWGTFHAGRGSATFWIVGYALAAVWIVGGLITAPIELGDTSPTTMAVVVGAGVVAFVVFYGAYRLLREIPVLSGALHGVVGTADAAHVVPVLVLAVVNAVAEEFFFRGAMFSLIAGRPVAQRSGPARNERNALIWSTVIYAAATAASFNIALVIAAIGVGGLLAVLRRWSGGVVAPVVAHVVWSSLMLLAVHR